MKPLLALLLTAVALHADTLTDTDSTSGAGAFHDTLKLTKFPAQLGTLTHVRIEFDNAFVFNGGVGTGNVIVGLSVKGVGVTQSGASDFVGASIKTPVGTILAQHFSSFADTENQAPGWNDQFIGHGDLKFKVVVTVQNGFGVNEEVDVDASVTYDYTPARKHGGHRDNRDDCDDQ